ncbi:2TM domain-containing protein [Tenacibaculum soleae]|uniref:2TM domain-containing protein n=1 Tax=Tenacibaculum soleae TaxID=447689 RepID=UPI002301C49E|nr:2TM domain-containing protein [Tenacibaculum soleae]
MIKIINKIKMDDRETQQYIQAKKRVKKIKGFYTHLTIYCIVIPTIIFANLKFEPHFHWFWFSLIGWGIGLFSHWLSVFGFQKIGIGKNWEERKIKEIMNEGKNNK